MNCPGHQAQGIRGCPVCGGGRHELLYTQRFRTIEGGSLLDGYDVVQCMACGMAYAEGVPEPAAFEAYYRDLSKYEAQYYASELNQYDLRRFPINAALVAPHLPALDAPIVDVGCAVGGQLWAFQQLGYSRLLGLDPSPLCARVAQERFGLRVLTGALLDLDPQEGPFDLIILGSVLEHLRDPRPALERLAGLLTPEGFLYLEVPDVLQFTEVLDAPFQEFSMEHINYFSPRTLSNLMAQIDLSPVFCRQTRIQQTPSKQVAEVKALYQRGSTPRFEPDLESARALHRYIQASGDMESRLNAILEGLAASHRPILVWGVGTHTQHLLANSRLADVNITAFVDANPRYQGLHMQGTPILLPESLAGRAEAILISSQQFQDEIAVRIRQELRLPNELILLYPPVQTKELS